MGYQSDAPLQDGPAMVFPVLIKYLPQDFTNGCLDLKPMCKPFVEKLYKENVKCKNVEKNKFMSFLLLPGSASVSLSPSLYLSVSVSLSLSLLLPTSPPRMLFKHNLLPIFSSSRCKKSTVGHAMK